MPNGELDFEVSFDEETGLHIHLGVDEEEEGRDGPRTEDCYDIPALDGDGDDDDDDGNG